MNTELNVIYTAWCVCHPEEGLRYVGQTSYGVDSRRAQHLWAARTEHSKSYNSHFSKWIRKHRPENVAFTVLEVCTVDELDAREMAWISDFRDRGYHLVNVLEGGVQPRGHKRPEHSERMSGEKNPMFGKTRTEIMAYARSFIGPRSEETKQKLSEARTGERNGRAVLTEDDVRYIRAQPRAYGYRKRLAEQFGVTPENIYLIVTGKSWALVR
jgi:hypothetical protein